MTVRELIAKLIALNNLDQIVIVSKDAEGNGHSPLAGVFEAEYYAENTWTGAVGEIGEFQGAVPALVITPVN